ncbi:hypothetical protein TWF696_006915 [Orbilia brochopaga]|uniref:Diaminopimelate epimerase-like protein n=1 Tax=Orbilia brochopaga TaxID=3140254 RepID=A0AAV9UTL1_9PEZI
MRLPYVTLDIFTTTPLSAGNPLAVVTVPPATSLTKAQEYLVAREFNYSETIFIYTDDDSDVRPRIAIWTTTEELPFAGHPTIGAAWYLANTGLDRYSGAFEIQVPAGIISVSRGDGGRMKVEVPTKISIWDSKIAVRRAREAVGLLTAVDNTPDSPGRREFSASCKDGVPVISLVDGLAFALIEVPDLDALGCLSPSGKNLQLDVVRDLGAATACFIGTYCYVSIDEDVTARRMSVRTRMFYDGVSEDPATGSAACALASFLAMARGYSGDGGDVEWRVEVTQGVEMERRSEIGVSVTIGPDGVVKKVVLEGAAVKVMEGSLTV